MGQNLPDQNAMWERKHAEGEHEKLRGVPSPLAELAVPYIEAGSHVLELGCGVARDAAYLAENGNTVLATDSSPTVIEQDKQRSAREGVRFEVLDIREAFPYETGSFDAVYSNLSLHYFYEDQTERIIKEIARVLRSGGVLAFACKSRDDQRTDGAEEIAPSLFVAANGHALRLFSKEYAAELIQDDFETVFLDEVEEEYQGRKSDIVRCIARKK